MFSTLNVSAASLSRHQIAVPVMAAVSLITETSWDFAHASLVTSPAGGSSASGRCCGDQPERHHHNLAVQDDRLPIRANNGTWLAVISQPCADDAQQVMRRLKYDRSAGPAQPADIPRTSGAVRTGDLADEAMSRARCWAHRHPLWSSAIAFGILQPVTSSGNHRWTTTRLTQGGRLSHNHVHRVSGDEG
jgi:hypothetical protein